MDTKHVLVLPFPAQGHVNPLMHFSNKLVQHGFKVTFVTTDFIHQKVVTTTNKKVGLEGSALRLISVPDGLDPQHDRNDFPRLESAILSTMPTTLENVIKDMNGISCIITDHYMAWALEVAERLGIKGAVFCTCSAAVVALQDNIPKLMQDGILDGDGLPKLKGKFQLSEGIPVMDTANIPWQAEMYSRSDNKIMSDYALKVIQYSHLTDWWLCNTTSELESAALSLCPKMVPIGPLIEDNNDKFRSLGQLWQEDLSCLSWLDQQPPCSVIYTAFGSTTIFDPRQFKEIALGLDLTSKPFLWVVREDANDIAKNNAYPDEFQGTKGKIVRWVPQQKVLRHPAIACFISHCGWNSTLEGATNGVPFLCWPYFADQIFNKSYICDEWKVGLGFNRDEKGLISRWEIKKKIDQLLGDENIKERSQNLKKMLARNNEEGGKSYENFTKLMEWLEKL